MGHGGTNAQFQTSGVKSSDEDPTAEWCDLFFASFMHIYVPNQCTLDTQFEFSCNTSISTTPHTYRQIHVERDRDKDPHI
jgi:hypothetical protein